MRIRYLTFALTATLVATFVCQAQNKEYNYHIERGSELYRSGKYAEALEEFGSAGRSTDNNLWFKQQSEYYYALSKAALSDGTEELELFIARYPVTIYYTEVMNALAGEYFEQGRFNDALRCYRAIDPDKLDSDQTDQYRFKSGYCDFVNGDYDRARSAFIKVDREGKFAPHALYAMGYIDYRNGDYDGAEMAFKSLVDNNQYADVVPYYLFQIEFNRGNYRYVVDNTEQILSRSQGERRREIMRIIAESCFRIEDWTGTEEFIGRYGALGGEMNREDCYLAGFAKYMAGDYKGAEHYLARACGPDDRLTRNAAYHLGDCYIRLGDKRRAMQSFAMACSNNSDDSVAEDALFNYGKLQFELGGGHFNEAINVLNRYLSSYPTSQRAAQVKELLIASYYNSRNYDQAYQALTGYRNPDNTMKAAIQKITYFKALEAMQSGDNTTAERYFDESQRYNYNAKYSALTKLWRGELNYREENYDTAAQMFDSYIRLSPEKESENTMARYCLAYAYFNNDQPEAARKWFDDFLGRYTASDSFRADALNRTGDLDASERSFWRAIETYNKAAAIDAPERNYAAYRSAVMLGMVDRRERKIEELNKIINKGEGDYVDDALYELGRTEMVGEEFEKASQTLTKFIARFPQSPQYVNALSDLGLINRNLSRNDEALRYYKMVVENSYQSVEARNAIESIKEIYVEQNRVSDFFRYADSAGMLTDVSDVQRDSLAYAAAQSIYMSGDKKRAASAFGNYVSGNQNGVYVAQALWYGSECAISNGDKQSAREQLTRLTSLAKNDYTERGLERLIGVCGDLGESGAKAEAWAKLSRVAATQSKRADALGGYVEAVAELGDNQATIEAADEVCGNADATDNVKNRALFVKARALTALDRQSEAMPIYESLSGNATTDAGIESAYRVIEATIAKGEYQKAEDLVYKVSEQRPAQSYWLGRIFLALGDTFVKRGNTFQARSTYQSIIDGYSVTDDGIRADAEQKIKELK